MYLTKIQFKCHFWWYMTRSLKYRFYKKRISSFNFQYFYIKLCTHSKKHIFHKITLDFQKKLIRSKVMNFFSKGGAPLVYHCMSFETYRGPIYYPKVSSKLINIKGYLIFLFRVHLNSAKKNI